MGEQNVQEEKIDEGLLRDFTRALLEDVRALEAMLNEDSFDQGARHIGAEQEMFLLDSGFRPSPLAVEVLERINDPRIVPELAKFNLEANLSPQVFTGPCLRKFHEEIEECLGLAREAAEEFGARVFLTGILPTLHMSDLQLENMTPNPRYRALNRAISALKGGVFKCNIKGVDELEITTDNVMLEAANTSFQIHYQVTPREFASLYNVSQAIAGPVLAAAVNSPLLLGRRLWKESRVAVFQHSIDARSLGQQARGHRPRVDFGSEWIEQSVLEIFQEDIARFRVVIATVIEERSLEILTQGKAPQLQALRLHNGTIYRWNRPCYGINDGVPHLRIESRALPAGPTVVDEIANSAFSFGLMNSVGHEYGDLRTKMDFGDAKSNFLQAARHGLEAQFQWPGIGTVPASVLILEHLLPLARAGLKSASVDEKDIDEYLGVLEERVKLGGTGARWALASFASMRKTDSPDHRCRALTAAAVTRQEEGKPVHTWSIAEPGETADWHHSYRTVGHCMSTDLLTVRPWDLVDLAASLMDWEKIRHVPVEDDEGHLVGLVSHRAMLRIVAAGSTKASKSPVTIESVMKKDPVTVTPNTPTLEAIELMREHKVGCLPVVQNDKLLGIITERDFIDVARGLLEQQLRQED